MVEVSDAGDGLYTSVGLFDNLRCFGDLECEDAITEVSQDICEVRLLGAAHTGGQSGDSTLYELDAGTGAVVAAVVVRVTRTSRKTGSGPE